MSVNPCPLCGSPDGALIRALPFAAIWRQLEEQHGARFSPELIDQLTPAETTALLGCRSCGLQYFRPAIAGNGEFYRQLTTADQAYYNAETWDFRCAIACAPTDSRLLDVACGGGAFLTYAQRHGLRAQGIDTNPAAIAQACAAGLTAELVDLEPFSQAHAGCFDLVTAFQVLEHLEAVVPFTQQAARCLRPGGRLLISVPNRHRLWRQSDEPLDCPPHHLSRWARPQFAQLVKRCGLELQAVYFEPASALDLLAPLQRRRQRSAATAPASAVTETKATPAQRAWLAEVSTPLRRPSQLLARLGLRRLGMLAELVVPTHR